MEQEQMRRELRAAVEKADTLEMELHIIHKLMEDEAADREDERAYLLQRINKFRRKRLEYVRFSLNRI
jgi:hypothetical protein